MNCYRYYWMLYILIAVLPSFSFAKKTDAQQVREMIEQVNDAWQKVSVSAILYSVLK